MSVFDDESFDGEIHIRRALIYIGSLILSGAAILAFQLSSIVYIWASSAFVCGVLLGFLFGIPKVVQSYDSDTSEQKNRRDYFQSVNTNLEQISDWLTKIIVGIGLVELWTIPDRFSRLVACTISGTDISPSFAGATLLYFAIVGFFTGYLLTRLYLAVAFATVDQHQFSKALKKIEPPAGEPAAPVDPAVADLFDISPAAAVAMSYRDLEATLKGVARDFDIPDSTTPTQIVRQLCRREIIDEQYADRIDQLSNLRNLAVHDTGMSISKSDAKTYASNVASLIRAINSRRPSSGPN